MSEDSLATRLEKLENRLARLEALQEAFPNYRRSVEEELEGLQGWCRQLQEELANVQDRVRLLEVRHGRVANVPTIPIPKDNTRSIEEILAVVEEIRAWTKRLRIE